MRCIKFLGIVALCSWICVEFTPLSYAQRGSLGHVGAGGGRGGGGRAAWGAIVAAAHAQMNRAGARPHAGGGAATGTFKRWRPAPSNRAHGRIIKRVPRSAAADLHKAAGGPVRDDPGPDGLAPDIAARPGGKTRWDCEWRTASRHGESSATTTAR